MGEFQHSPQKSNPSTAATQTLHVEGQDLYTVDAFVVSPIRIYTNTVSSSGMCKAGFAGDDAPRAVFREMPNRCLAC